jgi:hypothetical protein
MSTSLDAAQAELAAAQAKVAALSLVPQEDTYPKGTVLRWHNGGRNLPRVATKVAHGQWSVSGYAATIPWVTVVAQFLTYPLEYFDVAPADWSSARLAPPPPVETDGLKVTYQGNTWERHGNEWVLR